MVHLITIKESYGYMETQGIWSEQNSCGTQLSLGKYGLCYLKNKYSCVGTSDGTRKLSSYILCFMDSDEKTNNSIE